MRRFIPMVVWSACQAGGPSDLPEDTPQDTAPTDPVCAGFGEPCAALPARPEVVACGAALRVTVDAGLPVVWPEVLASLSCFDSLLPVQPAAGVIPFDVVAPLFSDGADKGRYLVLPPGQTITPAVDGPWGFPVGSLLLKIFALDLEVDGARAERPLEVRVMLLAQDGWKFATYAWDEALGDLTRVDDKGRTVGLTLPEPDGGTLAWYYPSQEACLTCHRVQDNLVIGVQTRQLHHRVDYGAVIADQLVAMDAIGLFSPSIATLGELPRLTSPYDTHAPVEDRARAWLHANCAHCHQPDGFAPPDLPVDLRVTTPFADTATCMVPKHSGLVTTGEHLIVPGSAQDSALVQRIRTTSFEKMPPDGASRYDSLGIQAVEAWINTLDGCP